MWRGGGEGSVGLRDSSLMASARVRVFNLSLHLRNGGKAVSGRGGMAGKWREGTCPDVFGGADVGYVRILSYLCRK